MADTDPKDETRLLNNDPQHPASTAQSIRDIAFDVMQKANLPDNATASDIKNLANTNLEALNDLKPLIVNDRPDALKAIGMLEGENKSYNNRYAQFYEDTENLINYYVNGSEVAKNHPSPAAGSHTATTTVPSRPVTSANQAATSIDDTTPTSALNNNGTTAATQPGGKPGITPSSSPSSICPPAQQADSPSPADEGAATIGKIAGAVGAIGALTGGHTDPVSLAKAVREAQSSGIKPIGDATPCVAVPKPVIQKLQKPANSVINNLIHQ